MSRPSRSQSSSVSLTPIAPGDREQVDDRVGRAADRAVDHDRVLERLLGQDLRHPQILAHHLDDAPAGHARQHLAPRVDRRNRRVGRQPHAQRLDHRRHRRRGAHRHAMAGRARHARFGLDHVRLLHLAGLEHLGELPRRACRSRCPRRGTCRSASGRRRCRSSAGRSDAAPISSAGVVLSQPIISTTPSNGLARIDSSTSIATWLRNSMAVGPHQRSRRGSSPGTRAGSRRPRARPRLTCSASSRKCALQGVTSRPGVADADHRPAVEEIVREALVLHPRAVDQRVAVVAAEPGSERSLRAVSSRMAHGVVRIAR